MAFFTSHPTPEPYPNKKGGGVTRCRLGQQSGSVKISGKRTTEPDCGTLVHGKNIDGPGGSLLLNKYQKTIGIAALLVSILLATAPFALAADAGASSTFHHVLARSMCVIHIYFFNLLFHPAYSYCEWTPEQSFQW